MYSMITQNREVRAIVFEEDSLIEVGVYGVTKITPITMDNILWLQVWKGDSVISMWNATLVIGVLYHED